MRRTLDFLLNDWLGVDALLQRPRFADHSAETFASVLDTCERIARDKFAPFNRLADTEEPWFDGEKVHLPAASHAAAKAYAESGMLAAAQDYELGGMQLPCVVEMAANSFFSKAGIGIGGGGMLTSGNANLLMAHGTPLQQQVFAKQEFAGRFSGTMCLSEPQAGSSLGDIKTLATPHADGSYRISGSKMWISGGEHELSENIVHMVLAKIPGGPPGVKGISLFSDIVSDLSHFSNTSGVVGDWSVGIDGQANAKGGKHSDCSKSNTEHTEKVDTYDDGDREEDNWNDAGKVSQSKSVNDIDSSSRCADSSHFLNWGVSI